MLGEVSIAQFKTGVVSVEGTQVGVVRDEEVTVLVQAVGLVKFIVTRRLVVKVDQHPVTRKLVALFPPKGEGRRRFTHDHFAVLRQQEAIGRERGKTPGAVHSGGGPR